MSSTRDASSARRSELFNCRSCLPLCLPACTCLPAHACLHMPACTPPFLYASSISPSLPCLFAQNACVFAMLAVSWLCMCRSLPRSMRWCGFVKRAGGSPSFCCDFFFRLRIVEICLCSNQDLPQAHHFFIRVAGALAMVFLADLSSSRSPNPIMSCSDPDQRAAA